MKILLWLSMCAALTAQEYTPGPDSNRQPAFRKAK